eukprot:SAG31_NODE_412_length_15972_cov_3.590626_13_plen_171_part_00
MSLRRTVIPKPSIGAHPFASVDSRCAVVPLLQCVAESLRLDRKNLRTMSAADRMRAVVGALEQNAAGARQVVAPIGSFKRVTSGQLDPTTGKPIVVAVPMPEDPSHPLQKSSSLHEQIMESHGEPAGLLRLVSLAGSLIDLRLRSQFEEMGCTSEGPIFARQSGSGEFGG